MTTALSRRPGPDQLAFPGLPVPPEPVRVRRGARAAAAELAAPPFVVAQPPAPAPCRCTTSQPARAVPRPHGPVKARQPVGELRGPAPTTRQVKTITVQVEQLDGNRWLLRMPRVPAWGQAASNSGQLVAAVRDAFREAQVAAYSEWRSVVYDGEVHSVSRRRPRRTAPMKQRKDIHSATDWLVTTEVDDNGARLWLSPKGLKYAEDRQVVQRVMDKRERMGLARRPDVAPTRRTA